MAHKWKQDVKAKCLDIISKKGIEKIKIDELVSEMMPEAKRIVPYSVKEELLNKIKDFVASNPEIDM